MLGDGALAFKEFVMGEETPLATIHAAVLQLLRGRNDIVLHGAQAVNAYVDEPRMTQHVDVLCVESAILAEELRTELNRRLHLAVRVREVQEGIGYRIYQLQPGKNRHLVNIRTVAELPPATMVGEIQVLTPLELIIAKIISSSIRRNTPKSFTDLRDLMLLLLRFPDFKSAPEIIAEILRQRGLSPEVLSVWNDIAAKPLQADDEDSEFDY